jgi:predicted ferric reductase
MDTPPDVLRVRLLISFDQWWGIIATIALCFAAGFAFLPFRIRFYETFLVLHIVFVIVALVGCWYHLVPHFGFDYGYQVWLYICFAFWAADRLARLARIAYYNRLGGSDALVEAIPGCDIMQVTVFPRVARGFGPAQHSFLYLAGLGKFWESHPFSVASWKTGSEEAAPSTTTASACPSAGDGKVVSVVHSRVDSKSGPSIRFLIRPHSGITSRCKHRLAGSSSSSAAKLSVYTEGPYGGHRATLHPLFSADTVLCVAGGIGITHVLGFLQEYYASAKLRGDGGKRRNRGYKAKQRLVLAWSAKEMHFIEHVRREFLIDVAGSEYLFWCTAPACSGAADLSCRDFSEKGQSQDGSPERVGAAVVREGRMDIGAVLRACAEPGRQTAVLTCGPGGMADEVTKQVVSCVKDGLRVDLVEEAFAW